MAAVNVVEYGHDPAVDLAVPAQPWRRGGGGQLAAGRSLLKVFPGQHVADGDALGEHAAAVRELEAHGQAGSEPAGLGAGGGDAAEPGVQAVAERGGKLVPGGPDRSSSGGAHQGSLPAGQVMART